MTVSRGVLHTSILAQTGAFVGEFGPVSGEIPAAGAASGQCQRQPPAAGWHRATLAHPPEAAKAARHRLGASVASVPVGSGGVGRSRRGVTGIPAGVAPGGNDLAPARGRAVYGGQSGPAPEAAGTLAAGALAEGPRAALISLAQARIAGQSR